MRLWPVAVLVSILAVPLHAAKLPADVIERAQREKTPILVFDRPDKCTGPCATFEQQALKHPAVQRRLAEFVFLTRPIFALPEAQRAGLTLFDRRGNLIAQLVGLPRDITAFGSMLDGIISVKPNLERAVVLAETEGPHEGELELAAALMILGRNPEARAAVERAAAKGTPATREMAVVVRAMLDANEGKLTEAVQALEALAATASAPHVAATARMGISAIQPKAEAAVAAPPGVIEVMPFEEQIISGRQAVRTAVSSTHVARVLFSVDGQEKASVDRPPFSTTIDFGRIPQVSTIRAVAFDVNSKEIGRDELTVNHAGEMFWIRLIEPREGKASGNVRVTATLRAPVGRDVKRVVVSWNDVSRAVITAEPWQADVEIPKELGVLQVKAELDDGRITEDAVLLNTSGFVDSADVPLVEIPVTIAESDGSPSRVAPKDLQVREGRRNRTIESVTSGTEAPLTVGMLFDASGSMYKSLLDVQEAAIGFLETAVGPKDRAFLIAFDHNARLVQTATSDRALLRKQLMSMRANGGTALHDAMILGLLQFEGIKGRRAMIVFSDGDDRASRFLPKDVEDLARRSNIPIYLIAAPPAARPSTTTPAVRTRRVNDPDGFIGSSPMVDPWAREFAFLTGVIRSTGGMTHSLKDLAELPKVYAKIEAALRAQSLVVIRTDRGRNENDWRKIDVEVAGRNRDVRAPAGYYAPW